MKIPVTTLLVLYIVGSAYGQSLQTGAISDGGQSSGPQSIKIMRGGSQPSREGPAENFTGKVRVDPLFEASAPGRARGSLVTFDPGAHTAWHTHPIGQVLIVTAGVGRVQRWGD